MQNGAKHSDLTNSLVLIMDYGGVITSAQDKVILGFRFVTFCMSRVLKLFADRDLFQQCRFIIKDSNVKSIRQKEYVSYFIRAIFFVTEHITEK